MTLSVTTLSQLQQVMTNDQGLQIKLKGIVDTQQAAAIVAEAAAQHGITVTQAELVQHFAESRNTLADQVLSDAELDAVAGGFSRDEFIAISVFSLGIGCLWISVDRNRSKALPSDDPMRMGLGTVEFCVG
ncbi:hypothetical protein MIZ03_2725 [Rhodoferax lithotrophicus]|uniref:Nif11 domain-containing protein n=1 Tax=Rhodoferax lithotrophicus TaxID=2798804 RepID=A0ABN6D726_9BURK|nr:hypothetical protein [Rhodoferax sp. MIZ03]BCO27834.1 hypothetical protein MIZ03_2725 [Rhodoferax sp. MIZ03]